jgi:hypothetical protein
MTSEELQKSDIDPRATFYLLKEIAYQLAAMNEDRKEVAHETIALHDAVVELHDAVEALGSKLGAGSETEVRGDSGKNLRTMLANALRPILTRASVHAGFSDWLASAIEQSFILSDREPNERTTPPNPQILCGSCGKLVGLKYGDWAPLLKDRYVVASKDEKQVFCNIKCKERAQV